MQQCYQWVHRNTPKQLYKSRPHDNSNNINWLMKEQSAVTRRYTVLQQTETTDQQLRVFCFYATITRSNFICGHTIFKESVFVTQMSGDVAMAV